MGANKRGSLGPVAPLPWPQLSHLPSRWLHQKVDTFLHTNAFAGQGSVTGTASHLEVPEHRVVFDSGEQHPHGVGSVVQEGDPSSVQVTGQLVDVRLQLGKSWHKGKPVRMPAGVDPESECSEPSPRPLGDMVSGLWMCRNNAGCFM